MRPLTYADREMFLRCLEEIRRECQDTDETILNIVAENVKAIVPTFGYEKALARDLTVLSYYLARHQAPPEIQEIAKGALLYFLRGGESRTDSLAPFGLLDDAFVASYSVHEIRMRLGLQAQ